MRRLLRRRSSSNPTVTCGSDPAGSHIWPVPTRKRCAPSTNFVDVSLRDPTADRSTGPGPPGYLELSSLHGSFAPREHAIARICGERSADVPLIPSPRHSIGFGGAPPFQGVVDRAGVVSKLRRVESNVGLPPARHKPTRVLIRPALTAPLPLGPPARPVGPQGVAHIGLVSIEPSMQPRGTAHGTWLNEVQTGSRTTKDHPPGVLAVGGHALPHARRLPNGAH